jgi:hypothetical protein
MIHGGGGQGTDFLGTADGREGWVHWFVRRGWAVYVVDRPQHGRSPFNPEFQGEMGRPGPTVLLEKLFTRPQDFDDNYPQASLHDKWPGSGTMDDPALLSFLAGTGPTLADPAAAQADAQRAGAELLDRIGPAIVLSHSDRYRRRTRGRCSRPRRSALRRGLMPRPALSGAFCPLDGGRTCVGGSEASGSES